MDGGDKKKRNRNLTNEECLCLAHSVAEYKSILRCKLGPTVTSEKKKSTWNVVTDRLNASFTANKRSQEEVEKKWHNIFSQSKAEIGAFKREQTQTGGGPSSRPLGEVAKVVSLWGVLGEGNAVLDGIEGSIDSSLLQLLQDTHFPNTTVTFQQHVAGTHVSQDVGMILATEQPAATTRQAAPPSLAFHWAGVAQQAAPVSAPPLVNHHQDPKSNKEIVEELTIKNYPFKFNYSKSNLSKRNKFKKNNENVMPSSPPLQTPIQPAFHNFPCHSCSTQLASEDTLYVLGH